MKQFKFLSLTLLILIFHYNICNAQSVSESVSEKKVNTRGFNFILGSQPKNNDATISFGGKRSENKKRENNDFASNSTRTSTSQIIKKDSAYYTNFGKKDGWPIGVGKKLTLEQAKHLNLYYKFSEKNAAGNWTRIESFNGYGKPAIGFTTYLVDQSNDNDQGANARWKSKLNTIYKIEFIGDIIEKEVIQEKAYDSNNNIVYTYTPVKVGEREYTGTYTDAWGMPIFMRTDSLGNDAGYANVVHVTRDERGFEILRSFTDRYGFPQKNKDGAYMTRCSYDNDGNKIKEESLNIVGDRMNDNYGNCGWEAKYEDGYEISCLYYDSDWKPIIITGFNGDWKVYGWNLEYDDYGRRKALSAINAKGELDLEHSCGFNTIKYEYDEHGNLILMEAFDTIGNRKPYNISGVSQCRMSYDNNGNQTYWDQKDVNDKYLNNINDYCKFVSDYNDDGKIINEIGYTSSIDSLEISYEYHMDVKGNEISTWRTNTMYDASNMIRIDSVDTQGRNILTAWYDLEGNPIDYDGRHKDITNYYDEKENVKDSFFCERGFNVVPDNMKYEININVDKKNNIVVPNEGGYSSRLYITNLTKNEYYDYQYYGDFLRYSFGKKYSPTNEIIQQWDITPYGEHARVGWWNNLYYTCDVDYTMYGEVRTMVGRNEFDEPSYLTSLGQSGEVYYFLNSDNEKRRYYNEEGKEIPDDEMEIFKDTLPKVFCIEVIDTIKAYPLNLRNGDIIISYGDWIINEDLRTDVNYFYLETILKANKKKQATLLRHNLEKKTSEIIRVNLPEGKTSDLGFYPHKIYYTQKEKNRLLDTGKNNGIIFNHNETKNDITILLGVQIKGGLYDAQHYYLRDIKDAGIIIYESEKHGKRLYNWNVENDSLFWGKDGLFDPNNNISKYLCFTQDLTSYKIESYSGLGNDEMIIIPIDVSDDLYNEIVDFYDNNSSVIKYFFTQVEQADDLPIGIVLGDEGYLAENGYNGNYIILKWCNWDLLSDEIEELFEEINLQEDHNKEIILLPYVVEDGDINFGDVIYMETGPGRLGMRIQSTSDSKYYIKVEEIYSNWKKKNKKLFKK